MGKFGEREPAPKLEVSNVTASEATVKFTFPSISDFVAIYCVRYRKEVGDDQAADDAAGDDEDDSKESMWMQQDVEKGLDQCVLTTIMAMKMSKHAWILSG